MELLINRGTESAIKQALRSGSGSYVITGTEAVGKFYALATLIHTGVGRERELMVVEASPKTIGIEQMQDLSRRLRLKSERARIVIIRDAHKMTLAAQNAALKTLEEPPSGTLIFLTANQKSQLLPTIASRLKEIRFLDPAVGEVEHHLIQYHHLTSAKATEVAELSGNAVGEAVSLVENDEKYHRLQNYRQIALRVYESTDPYQAFKLAQAEKDLEPGMLVQELIKLLRRKLRESAKSDNINDIAFYNRQLQRYHQLLSYLEANGSPKLAINQIILSK